MRYLLAFLFLKVLFFGACCAQGVRNDTLLLAPDVDITLLNGTPFSFMFMFGLRGDLCLTDDCFIFIPKAYDSQHFCHNDSFKPLYLPYRNIIEVRKRVYFFGGLLIKAVTRESIPVNAGAYANVGKAIIRRYMIVINRKNKEISRIIKSKMIRVSSLNSEPALRKSPARVQQIKEIQGFPPPQPHGG